MGSMKCVHIWIQHRGRGLAHESQPLLHHSLICCLRAHCPRITCYLLKPFPGSHFLPGEAQAYDKGLWRLPDHDSITAHHLPCSPGTPEHLSFPEYTSRYASASVSLSPWDALLAFRSHPRAPLARGGAAVSLFFRAWLRALVMSPAPRPAPGLEEAPPASLSNK